MRHRIEAGAPQPGAGSYDVMMGDTAWMVDEDRRAGREEPAQLISRKVIARPDLDGGAGDQFCHPAAMPVCCRCHCQGLRATGHHLESRLREIT
jgi:hypothetical protein